RRVPQADDQSLGAGKASHGLAPRFGAGAVQEPVAAPFELLGGVGRVFHLELDGRLGSRNVVGPVVGAEAGLGRLLEGPQAEVLDALDLLAVQVAVAVFELEAEGVDVEPAGGDL